MKKRVKTYIKKEIGIFLIIIGIYIYISESIFTGAVIGFSTANEFRIIGFIIFLIGGFLTLEERIKTYFNNLREERKKDKKRLFSHRLEMARVSKPLIYVFNEQKYDKKILRDILKRTTMLPKSEDDWLRKKELHYIGKIGAFYSPRKGKFFFRRGRSDPRKPSTHAHELLHHFDTIKLVQNDLVIANAINVYMDMVKEYEEAKYSQVDLENYKPKISYLGNLRKLTAKEKRIKGELEHKKEPGFSQTGSDLGNVAGYIEGISKKTGAGLYFIKLVSDGVPLEKAKDKVLDNYKPLENFEKIYGNTWRRILERCYYRNINKNR